jgi:hypothetical protein
VVRRRALPGGGSGSARQGDRVRRGGTRRRQRRSAARTAIGPPGEGTDAKPPLKQWARTLFAGRRSMSRSSHRAPASTGPALVGLWDRYEWRIGSGSMPKLGVGQVAPPKDRSAAFEIALSSIEMMTSDRVALATASGGRRAPRRRAGVSPKTLISTSGNSQAEMRSGARSRTPFYGVRFRRNVVNFTLRFRSRAGSGRIDARASLLLRPRIWDSQRPAGEHLPVQDTTPSPNRRLQLSFARRLLQRHSRTSPGVRELKHASVFLTRELKPAQAFEPGLAQSRSPVESATCRASFVESAT